MALAFTGSAALIAGLYGLYAYLHEGWIDTIGGILLGALVVIMNWATIWDTYEFLFLTGVKRASGKKLLNKIINPGRDRGFCIKPYNNSSEMGKTRFFRFFFGSVYFLFWVFDLAWYSVRVTPHSPEGEAAQRASPPYSHERLDFSFTLPSMIDSHAPRGRALMWR